MSRLHLFRSCERIKNEIGGPEAEIAGEQLFEVQMRFANILKEIFVEYQPFAFGRVGEIEDYFPNGPKAETTDSISRLFTI